jgi:hypothetical protein
VDRVVHVPYTVEQDETGWWAAHASLPGDGANGNRSRSRGPDIRPGTLPNILRDTGVTVDECRRLL